MQTLARMFHHQVHRRWPRDYSVFRLLFFLTLRRSFRPTETSILDAYTSDWCAVALGRNLEFQKNVQPKSRSLQPSHWFNWIFCSLRGKKKQLTHSSLKQQRRIPIMIITVLLECSKPKQPRLQRDKINRHELNKARAVFKKANSLKSENKEVLKFGFELRKAQINAAFRAAAS